MTALSAGTIMPAAYSIDGKRLDAVYVSGMSGKPDGLYMRTGRLSSMLGRHRVTLNEHVKNSAINFVIWDGRRYLCMDDVKPDGYMYVEEAADAAGYSAVHLRKLARRGTLTSTYRLGRLLIWVYDALKYAKERTEFPEGCISNCAATSKYKIDKVSLQRLVSSGKVRIVPNPGHRPYLWEADIQSELQTDNLINCQEAAAILGCSVSNVRKIARTFSLQKKLVHGRLLLRKADVEWYANKRQVKSKQPEEPPMYAATPDTRYALRNKKGQLTPLAEELYDRHALKPVNDSEEALVQAMLNELKEKGNGHGRTEKDVRAMVKMFARTD